MGIEFGLEVCVESCQVTFKMLLVDYSWKFYLLSSGGLGISWSFSLYFQKQERIAKRFCCCLLIKLEFL